MQTYRHEFFIKRDFGFYDSGILGCLPHVIFDVYEVIRRWVWRSLETGDPESRKLYSEGKLSTIMSQSEIADALDRDRKTINGHVQTMRDLGWMVVIADPRGLRPATYVLGERIYDSVGRPHEVFYADAWMKALWDRLEGTAEAELGSSSKVGALAWDRRREVCKEFMSQGSKVLHDSSVRSVPEGRLLPPVSVFRDIPMSEKPDVPSPENRTDPLSRKTDSERREETERKRTGRRERSASAPPSFSETPAGPKPQPLPLILRLSEDNVGHGSANTPEKHGNGHNEPRDRLAVLADIVQGSSAAALDPRGETWRDKTQRQRQRQVELSAQKASRLHNLVGSAPLARKQALNRLRAAWERRMVEVFGPTSGKWGPPELKQMAGLLDAYTPAQVEAAVGYVISQWTRLKDRLLKGKGDRLTVSFLARFHATIVPEAQDFTALQEVSREWNEWFAAHPNDDPPPELEARYQAVKAQLAAVGLV